MKSNYNISQGSTQDLRRIATSIIDALCAGDTNDVVVILRKFESNVIATVVDAYNRMYEYDPGRDIVNLRSKRMGLGLTQADVAERLGINATYVSAIERYAEKILSLYNYLEMDK